MILSSAQLTHGPDRDLWDIDSDIHMPIQRKDVPVTPPPLSPFADRLSQHATAVANLHDGYATNWHAHDCDMLLLPVSGRFDIVDAHGTALQSTPGQFVWFAAGAAHVTAAQTLRQTHLAVYVDPDFWATLLRAHDVERPVPGMRNGSAALSALTQRLMDEARSSTGGEEGAVYCGALIMEAARLSASPAMTEQRTPLRLIADLLIQYIDSDLARPLSLDLFAEKHRMSRRHIERVFRAEFSMSPLEFQQVRRVERARYLLQTTDDSVLSVAQQVGWESGSYLSRVLGKTWARTAAEIRADAKSAKSVGRQG